MMITFFHNRYFLFGGSPASLLSKSRVVVYLLCIKFTTARKASHTYVSTFQVHKEYKTGGFIV